MGADAKAPFIVLEACCLPGHHAIASTSSFVFASVRGFVISPNTGIQNPTAQRNTPNCFFVIGSRSFIIVSILSGSVTHCTSLRINPRYLTSFLHSWSLYSDACCTKAVHRCIVPFI